MPKAASLHTERLVIRQPGPDEAQAVVDYYVRNRAHLAPWEPRRDADFFTEAWWRPRLEADLREFAEDVSARFFAFAHDAPALAVGACDLNNIVRGAFQACYLGYSMDGASQGRGLGAEAVAAVVDCGFQTLGLHRIMANYQPDNERSARLLASLGFVVEGRAQEYLLLGGRWSDHVLTAKTAPDWLDQWEPQK